MKESKKQEGNILLRMHPLHRVIISIVLALGAYLLVKKYELGTLIKSMISWDAFALTLIASSWVVLCTRSVPQIRQFARKEDGSRIFVFLVVLISSFASMFSVLRILVSQDPAVPGNPAPSQPNEILFLCVTVAGMMLSWVLVHTIFTFHYAHIFYDDDNDKPAVHAGGLIFPGDKTPDYLDFAYFSFVIGMTFQVSDINITSARIRRLALLHGLISFALNTFVVALTINMIAGLKK